MFFFKVYVICLVWLFQHVPSEPDCWQLDFTLLSCYHWRGFISSTQAGELFLVFSTGPGVTGARGYQAEGALCWEVAIQALYSDRQPPQISGLASVSCGCLFTVGLVLLWLGVLPPLPTPGAAVSPFSTALSACSGWHSALEMDVSRGASRKHPLGPFSTQCFRVESGLKFSTGTFSTTLLRLLKMHAFLLGAPLSPVLNWTETSIHVSVKLFIYMRCGEAEWLQMTSCWSPTLHIRKALGGGTRESSLEVLIASLE